MVEFGWAYWHITTIGLFISCLVLVARIAVSRVSMPDRRAIKWIAFRGVFGGVYWALGIVAVQVGAGPGDVAALLSINIVMAAFLGRAFLGEELRVVHIAALVCSLVGAVLISRPAFIFGVAAHAESAWFGHLCAAFAGCAQSLAFLCSRKAAEVPTSIHTFASMVASLVICVVLVFSNMMEQPSKDIMTDSPLLTAAFVAGAFVVNIAAVSCMCFAAAVCPVAITATCYTASTMMFGYVAQVLIFDGAPDAITLVGAAFMLLAVVLMMGARVGGRGRSSVTPATGAESATEAVQGVDGEEDENDSLSSFIATELCSFQTTTVKATSMRFRGSLSGEDTVLPQEIGYSLSILPIAAVIKSIHPTAA